MLAVSNLLAELKLGAAKTGPAAVVPTAQYGGGAGHAAWRPSREVEWEVGQVRYPGDPVVIVVGPGGKPGRPRGKESRAGFKRWRHRKGWGWGNVRVTGSGRCCAPKESGWPKGGLWWVVAVRWPGG